MPQESTYVCHDLIVPFHPDDAGTFIQQSGMLRMQQHIQGWGRMYIISGSADLFRHLLNNRTIWFDERSFSFHSVFQRGWYLQQAIKIVGPTEIPGLCDRFTVLDADLVFLRPMVPTVGKKINYIFADTVPHGEYFRKFNTDSAEFLTETLAIQQPNPDGPICSVHHLMTMELSVLREIFARIELQHNQTFCQRLQLAEQRGQWASEYDMYFSFMWNFHRDRMVLYKLPALQCRPISGCSAPDFAAFEAESDVVFMACHDKWASCDICFNSENNCTSSRAMPCDAEFCASHENDETCAATTVMQCL